MTTRLDIMEAARQRIVKDGHCPECLRDLVELHDKLYGYCPQHIAVVYSLKTGKVLGRIT